MKILLAGEYSRLHNSLKEGLTALGHETILMGTGDSFKNYPSDIPIDSDLKNNKYFQLLRKVIYKIGQTDILQFFIYKNAKQQLPDLQDFDIVQFINQDPFVLPPEKSRKINNILTAQNKKAFLLACGEDSHIMDYYSRNLMKYSILSPLIKNPSLQKKYAFSLKYLSEPYKEAYEELTDKIQKIIPTDFDYAIPYSTHPKSAAMIPNPVNVDKIKFEPMQIKDKIRIFHGINTHNFYKKGSDIILKVLKRIGQKYPEYVEIQITENLPYEKYMKTYKESHIFIDQLYSYDQGYNALEAMAAGKCVLSGAEKEWKDFYQPEKEVLINALPDEEKLYEILEELIQDPRRIIAIGKNAREFIEKEHHYIDIAGRYLEIWNETK